MVEVRQTERFTLPDMHATELGVDVFLGKPYEESELLRHIATLAQRAVAN